MKPEGGKGNGEKTTAGMGGKQRREQGMGNGKKQRREGGTGERGKTTAGMGNGKKQRREWGTGKGERGKRKAGSKGAPAVAAAQAALARFEAGAWGQRFPLIAPLWRRHWERVAPALAYPLDVRRLLYSTNAIESLHMQLRKSLKIRGHFPNDEAASKLIYLALRNAVVKLGSPKHWRSAMQHISLLFGDRVPGVE